MVNTKEFYSEGCGRKSLFLQYHDIFLLRSEVVSYSLLAVEALVQAVKARADWSHCRQDSDLTPWHKVWAAVLRYANTCIG